jgi:hypothetical protein
MRGMAQIAASGYGAGRGVVQAALDRAMMRA